jgi:hypothetical protein
MQLVHAAPKLDVSSAHLVRQALQPVLIIGGVTGGVVTAITTRVLIRMLPTTISIIVKTL